MRLRRWLPVELDDQGRVLLGRLTTATIAFVIVTFIGASGYHLLGGGRWTYDECLYMAIITLSTVGFGETLVGMDAVPWARAWTVTLIILGSGTLIYFASTLTALVVEGDLRGAIRRRRMNSLIDELSDHVIVCGCGSTGTHVLEELRSSRTPFVVVDQALDRIERAMLEVGPDLLYVHGDATLDHVLQRAGIERAMGLISALTDDRDNLFVTVTARSLSERIRIVAKAVDSVSVSKLKRAGADAVVSPAAIGGSRLASEMVRPSVVHFLDAMVRDQDQQRRIEEVAVTAESPVAGRTLGEAQIGGVVDALVIAIRLLDGHHEYNPPASTVLRAGMVLIALVRTEEIVHLRDYVAGRK